jgi:hypothetical protein
MIGHKLLRRANVLGHKLQRKAHNIGQKVSGGLLKADNVLRNVDVGLRKAENTLKNRIVPASMFGPAGSSEVAIGALGAIKGLRSGVHKGQHASSQAQNKLKDIEKINVRKTLEELADNENPQSNFA